MHRSVALTACVTACLTLVATAQQKPTQTPVFRSSVDLVHLDVSVLDSDRRPVRGLTESDFTVIEDGKPQSIIAFSAVDVPTIQDPEPEWKQTNPADVQSNIGIEDPEGRLFVLLLDDAMMPPSPAALATARKVARDFIARVTPADRVAVVFSASGRNQNFTADKARLITAIDSLKQGHAAYLGGWDSAQKPPFDPDDRMPNIFAPLSDPDMAWRQASMATLRQVAETLISAPQRRKALVLVSPGIAVDTISATLPIRPAGGSFAAINDRTNMREANLALSRGMPELFTRMRRANVTVYPIDPCGADGLRSYIETAAASIYTLTMGSLVDDDTKPLLSSTYDWLNPGEVPPTPAALAQHLSSLNLQFLEESAKNTGGALVISNDFTGGLDRIFRENSSYYLLGYQQPSGQLPGSVHNIKVQVNRPGVTIRTRSGYAVAEAPKAKARPVSTLDKAIMGAVANGAFPMRVAIAPILVPGEKNPTVTIAIGLAQPGVGSRSSYTVNLQTNAYLADGTPRLIGQRHTANVVLRPSEAGNTARYELLTRVSLPPGRYELRLSAHRDLDNVSGSVYADVEVPDFSAPLAVSGVIVEAVPAGVTAPPGAFDAFLPVLPSSNREFTRGQDVTAFMRIYQNSTELATSVAVNTRIVDAANKQVGEGRDVIPAAAFRIAGRAADYRFGIPVGKLPRGEYLLTMDVVLFGDTVRRTVRFQVK